MLDRYNLRGQEASDYSGAFFFLTRVSRVPPVQATSGLRSLFAPAPYRSFFISCLNSSITRSSESLGAVSFNRTQMASALW